jgi:hypothetical protein
MNMMPSTVKIGAQVFTITMRSRDEDGMLNDNTLGYTLELQNLIVVDKQLPVSKKRLTLLHELMHAMGFVFDTSVKPSKKDDFDTWEHYFIGIWEEPLLMLLRDNPALVAYLVED